RDFHVTGVQTCALPISDGLALGDERLGLLDLHRQPGPLGPDLPAAAVEVREAVTLLLDALREGVQLGEALGEGLLLGAGLVALRSEERRVGNEGRSRRW